MRSFIICPYNTILARLGIIYVFYPPLITNFLLIEAMAAKIHTGTLFQDLAQGEAAK